MEKVTVPVNTIDIETLDDYVSRVEAALSLLDEEVWSTKWNPLHIRVLADAVGTPVEYLRDAINDRRQLMAKARKSPSSSAA